jgi:hypothetical protein
MEILNWSYNGEKGVVELTIEQANTTETLLVEVPETTLIEMSSVVPAIFEKKKVNEMLDLIYKIEKEQLLSVEALAKKMDELEKAHAEVRDELSVGNLSKEDILALSVKSKDLVGVKALFTDKRHMIKLLGMKEAELRLRLAKMQAGY